MRHWVRKGCCGSPTWSAWNPKMSARVVAPVDTPLAGPEDGSMTSIIPIPAFADNYIWLVRDGTRAAVVDPGDARPVLDYLAREGLGLAAILATHHHNDHVGGIDALLA